MGDSKASGTWRRGASCAMSGGRGEESKTERGEGAQERLSGARGGCVVVEAGRGRAGR